MVSITSGTAGNCGVNSNDTSFEPKINMHGIESRVFASPEPTSEAPSVNKQPQTSSDIDYVRGVCFV